MNNHVARFLILPMILNFSILISSAKATDCIKYKTAPSLEIKVPKFSVSIIQPDKKMDLLHGSVVSTFAEEYEIEYGARRIGGGDGASDETGSQGGGWCVFIEGISAVIGYTDFVVQIDKRHPFDSCMFNAIKEHEDSHIRAHLSVIEDNKKDISRSISGGANNVLPIFVQDEFEIDQAMEDLESALSDQPQIKLLRQKLAAEQEIRNKRIDLNDKGEKIRACGG